MKVLVSGLLTAIAIGFHGATAHAQATPPNSPAPVGSQSAPLTTQPASINQMPGARRLATPSTPYTSDQLNSTLGILQANPNVATPAPTNSLESLIQRFSNADRKPAAIDPIDFFKPPALEGGVKIPLSR